jgi:hypothetical protein
VARIATAAWLGLFLLAGTGCGGGTTTVIEKTVVSDGSSTSSSSTPTFLKAVAFEHLYVEPKAYPFSADGSLVGTDLTWEDWDSSTATGRGKIEERDFSSGEFNDRPTYPGAVVARGIEECRGRNYYTEVVAEVPPDAVYVPSKASQLTTPCRSFESIQAEERTEASGTSFERSSFFFTPSRNIACAVSPKSVRCDIASKSWKPPPQPPDCQLDWGNSVSVSSTEGSRILCAGDSLFGGRYRVLHYGDFVQRGEISCLSEKDGIFCINEAKEGFLLAYQELKLF